MGLLSLTMISFALATDAFAVSVSNGICYRDIKKMQVLQIAFTFGFFQALMPIIGYFLGQTFLGVFSKADHWIAFILLSFVGLHMITEAIKSYKSKEASCKRNSCTIKSLIVQGIATSLDAFAVGVSFAVIEINIFTAAALIGAITFSSSLLGVWIGGKFKNIVGGYAELIGGLILIGIGIKILLEGIL